GARFHQRIVHVVNRLARVCSWAARLADRVPSCGRFFCIVFVFAGALSAMADDPTISLLEPLENAYRTLRVRGTVVLAVSGGADSMALLRATCAIARQIDLDVVVAHLDHALRPEGADEARFVAAAAMEQGARFAGDRVDVRRESASTQRGIEETARRLRYEFLTRIAVQCGAAFVATAHTRNDLAE